MEHAEAPFANTGPRFPSRPLLWFVKGVVKRTSFLRQAAIDLFENIYYDSLKSTWDNSSWLGVPCKKYPTDLWVYQEIIYQNRPDIIIETGTLFGGSALYLASLLDLVGHGRVISIDVEFRDGRPNHHRITYLTGSSTSPAVISELELLIRDTGTRMVILDSDHSQAHVEEELRIYSRYVTLGQYLIVEDSAINGHPVYPRFGPGPFEAIETFLNSTDEFVIDKTKEKFFLSANHSGNLRRIK